MTLFEYYKAKVYELGYRDGVARRNNRAETNDIYYNDEMDFYICSDYYGSYVGGIEDWTEEDASFLNALGLNTHDFEEETDYE